MSIIDFFRDWIGYSSGYDFIFIIVASGVGLVIFDNILRSVLGVITSLFRGKKK